MSALTAIALVISLASIGLSLYNGFDRRRWQKQQREHWEQVAREKQENQ